MQFTAPAHRLGSAERRLKHLRRYPAMRFCYAMSVAGARTSGNIQSSRLTLRLLCSTKELYISVRICTQKQVFTTELSVLASEPPAAIKREFVERWPCPSLPPKSIRASVFPSEAAAASVYESRRNGTFKSLESSQQKGREEESLVVDAIVFGEARNHKLNTALVVSKCFGLIA